MPAETVPTDPPRRTLHMSQLDHEAPPKFLSQLWEIGLWANSNPVSGRRNVTRVTWDRSWQSSLANRFAHLMISGTIVRRSASPPRSRPMRICTYKYIDN